MGRDEQERSRDHEEMRSSDDKPLRYSGVQSKQNDYDQKQRIADQGATNSQSKYVNDNMPPCNIIDKVFASPTPLPDLTSVKSDKTQISTTGRRTWGERVDAELKPEKVISNEDNPDNLDKENNPWKKRNGNGRETDKKKLKIDNVRLILVKKQRDIRSI